MRASALCSLVLAAACTGPQPEPRPPAGAAAQPVADESFSPMESSIVAGINRERRAHGIGPLIAEPRLTRAARLHAANMAARRELSHTLSGATTSTLVSRISDVGYRYSAVAENLAYGPIAVAPLVDGWMRSPTHRDNILNPTYTETGVGVARSRDGVLFHCQVFGRPSSVP